jgi:hypothetical protein
MPEAITKQYLAIQRVKNYATKFLGLFCALFANRHQNPRRVSAIHSGDQPSEPLLREIWLAALVEVKGTKKKRPVGAKQLTVSIFQAFLDVRKPTIGIVGYDQTLLF